MRATRFDCLVRFDLECRARLRSHQRATNARIIHRSEGCIRQTPLTDGVGTGIGEAMDPNPWRTRPHPSVQLSVAQLDSVGQSLGGG